MRLTKLPLLCAALACVAATPLAARAEPSAADQARAEALFDEGKRLMDAKKFDEACPKFEESQRLDEAGGTLAALALCHQAQGRTATAWAEFKALLALANRTGHADRKKLAEAAIKDLEPKLIWLTIEVPAAVAALPSFELRLDGAVLGKGSWGSALPTDPGNHTLVAAAPGHAPWKHAFTLGPASERRTQAIPPLEPLAPPPAASSAPPAPPATPPATSAPTPRPTAPAAARSYTPSIVLGSVGAAALLAGGYFGLRALSQQREANEICPERDCKDDGAVARSQDASRNAWVSNVGVGVGLAGLLAAYLLLPPSASPSARARPWTFHADGHTRGGSVRLQGTF